MIAIIFFNFDSSLFPKTIGVDPETKVIAIHPETKGSILKENNICHKIIKKKKKITS